MRLLPCIPLALIFLAVDCSNGEPSPRPIPGTLRLTVLELQHHGLAMVLETPSGKIFIIDTGKKEDSDTVAKFLKARKIKRIDGIVVSHSDRDHYEGAGPLLKNHRVGTLVHSPMVERKLDKDYREIVERARKKDVKVETVAAGAKLAWDDALEVTVLAPPPEGLGAKSDDVIDENSIVLRIQHGDVVLLLPGDIGKPGADFLLNSIPPHKLAATVLIAPHHGFFEGRNFAAIVCPQHVVVACLADYPDKKPRSPARQAEMLFAEVGARVYVTAFDGNIEVVSDGKTCTVNPKKPRPNPVPPK